MSKRRIIPLPMCKIDPMLHPDGLFKTKQVKDGLQGSAE